MTSSCFRAGAAGYVSVAFYLACFVSSLIGGPNQLVPTIDPLAGPPESAAGTSSLPLITPDGRFVLFASTANNLVTGTPFSEPVPAPLNVFLRDRTNATTLLVSINTNGTAAANDDCYPAALSGDGRFVIFESAAGNLVAGDTNGASDIFVRDLLAQTTTLASVATNGQAGNGGSFDAVSSANGRFVSFVSTASNLVPGDTNGIANVFVRDMLLNITTRASQGAIATNHNFSPDGFQSPEITPDGRFVAFQSTATNPLNGFTSINDVYLRDLQNGVTWWVTAGARDALYSNLGTTNAVCWGQALSDDGRYVAYGASPAPGSANYTPGLVLRFDRLSGLTDLVHTNAAVPLGPYDNLPTLDISADGRLVAFTANTNGVNGGTTCILLWDADTLSTTLLSATPVGTVPAGSFCSKPSFDPSDRYVAFLSDSPGLATNSLSGDYFLYVHDLQTGLTSVAAADSQGLSLIHSASSTPQLAGEAAAIVFQASDNQVVPGDHNHADDIFLQHLVSGTFDLVSRRHPDLPSSSPNGSSMIAGRSVSADGRFITFAADGANLVPGDFNGMRDVFLRDLAYRTNQLVSLATNGLSGDSISFDPVISADGRYVAFTSWATNLVPLPDLNKRTDVFVRDLLTGTTTLASINSTGVQAANGPSYSPLLSADGRFLLFRSRATDLAPVLNSLNENLFLRDLHAQTSYALTTYSCGPAAMTPSGSFIAFVGSLGAGNGYFYVWDTAASARVYTNFSSTFMLSSLAISPDGNLLAWSNSSELLLADRLANSKRVISSLAAYSQPAPCFSGNGRWLLYGKTSAGVTNQIYLYDLLNGGESLVSHAPGSAAPATGGASDSADISHDGRFVVYRSAATNLVAGDANHLPDLFLFDRQTGRNTLLSANLSGSFPNNRSLTPAFSADGQSVLFVTWASDVAPGDFNTSADVVSHALLCVDLVPGPSAQGPWLTWPFVPGNSYEVQFSETLEGAWQVLPGTPTNLANKAWLQDQSPAPGRRFYRIHAY